LRALLPGLALAVAIALAAKGISWAADGAVSAILCAVVLGLLWRNVVGLGAWAEPGLRFAGETLLRIGIALVGLRLTWAALADAGTTAIVLVAACIAVALVVAAGVGRLLGVTPGIRRLIAAGTAICGCTAIVVLAPILRARKEDVGVAIACIVLFGSLALVGFPWLAAALLGTDGHDAGMFFGAAIQDTSQVVGAALIYAAHFDAPDAVAIAGFTKFLRTSTLLVLVPAAAAWSAYREDAPVADSPQERRPRLLPWFVVAFVLLAGVRAAGDLLAAGAPWADQWLLALTTAQRVSELLLLCGLAAVGLGITFAHLRDAGWRPVFLALLAATATGSAALLLLAGGVP
jgi:uncharacterized integral membrane protein (TIGR00698 family)